MVVSALNAHQTPSLRSFTSTSWTACGLSYYQPLLFWLFTSRTTVNHVAFENERVPESLSTALVLYMRGFKNVYALSAKNFNIPP